jgi:hypothetical protein
MIKPVTAVFVLFFFLALPNHHAAQGFSVNATGLEQSVIHVPARVITHLAGHHWFGYYDKLQFMR